MFKAAAMVFFYCETPLHAGSGTNISHVDLPLQRERHTNYPIIQASGVKGACRDWAEGLYQADKDKRQEIIRVFGPATEQSSDHSGSLAFTDAQVLLFPVRSFAGGFAWITCPQVLDRFRRRLVMLGETGEVLEAMAALQPEEDQALTADPCQVARKEADQKNGTVILEDIALEQDVSQAGNLSKLASWLKNHALPAEAVYDYIKNRLEKSLVVVPDDYFQDFVNLSTEVVTRIRIGEAGTVETGALWSQELLLADTLLYSLALAKDLPLKDNGRQKAQKSMEFLQNIIREGQILQLGGDETLGRGLVRPRYYAVASGGAS